MNRGIDHLVLCVHDLEAARDFYAALGFRLTPTAHHPFGTANSLVQLDGCFLELLSVADPAMIEPPDAGQFSFAHYNQTSLDAGEGMSMLVFESRDAHADLAEFKLKRLDTYAPFDFSRAAKLPNGDEVTVGFSLAFVTHPDMPRAVFFCCQQHAPQHFWKSDYQAHDNGARTVRSVILVASEPHRFATFFQSLQGTGSVRETAGGLVVATARGQLLVVSPEAYGRTYGVDAVPDMSSGPRFAAMIIEVPDLAVVSRLCTENGVAVHSAVDAVRIPAEHAFGTLIEFCEN